MKPNRSTRFRPGPLPKSQASPKPWKIPSRIPFLSARACLAVLFSLLPVDGLHAGVVYGDVETFDDPVPTSSSQSPGDWYPDRYPPAAFESYNLNGRNVLRIGIDTDDGAQDRPPPAELENAFYNTQGRKYDLPAGSTQITAMIYFPASWEGGATRRRSDFWATALNVDDDLAFIPIIGIANNDGNPVIRFYNSSTDLWTNTAVTPVPGNWYRFDVLLIGNDIVYVVNNREAGRVDANGASYLADAALQAYNYNDANLDPQFVDNAEDYDAYWDNFSFDFVFTGPYRPDLSVNDRRRGRFKGDNGYHPFGGKVLRDKLRTNRVSRAWVKLQNDGSLRDTVVLHASESSRNIANRKIFSFDGGRRNVTGAMLRGQYRVDMAPGDERLFKTVIKLKKKARKRARRKNSRMRYQLRVAATSDTDPALRDAVRLRPVFKDPRRPAAGKKPAQETNSGGRFGR